MVEPERTDLDPSEDTSLRTEQNTEIEAFGRALASVLSDQKLRLRLLRDLRDSPFREHSIHLQSYLRGKSGSHLAEAVRETLGRAEGRSLLTNAPTLELVMPSPYQRSTWTGDVAPFVLASTTARAEMRQQETVSLWTSDGRRLAKSMFAPLRTPLVVVVPAWHEFGNRPEQTRQSAPEQDRKTVSPRGFVPRHGSDDHAAGGSMGLRVGADRRLVGSGDGSSPAVPGGRAARGPNVGAAIPTTATGDASVSTGPGYAPGGGVLPSDVTWTACVDDFGNASEYCLYQIAHAFRPVLWFDMSEEHESRETYWAARTAYYGKKISAFYALAYHDDSGHIGDSEFIWLNAGYIDGRWQLVDATYSAHWRSTFSLFDDTETYTYDQLQYADAARGKPISYAAEGKHANYASQAECSDDLFQACEPGLDTDEFVFVDPDRYLGYDTSLGPIISVDCVASIRTSAADGHSLPGTECFWSDQESFDGWHGVSSSPLPYRESLEYWDDWLYADVEAGSGSSDCSGDREAIRC